MGVASGRRLPSSFALEYDRRMKLLAGTVKDGKVVLSGASLPEGSVVAVYAPEPAVRLPVHLRAELDEAIAEADREEGISAEELFAQLEKYR